MAKLSHAGCFHSPDILQGYVQMPLAPAAQERALHDFHSPMGLCTPTRVPQGVLNAKSYFQPRMFELLDGLRFFIWMDDAVYWEK